MEEESKKQTGEWKAVNPKKKKEREKHGIGVKILKIVLVLVAMLAITYTIIVIRNYILLKKIAEKVNQYNNTTNYSYSLTSLEGEKELGNYQYFRKDDIGKMISDSNKIIVWKDKKEDLGLLYSTEAKRYIDIDVFVTTFDFIPGPLCLYTEGVNLKQVALTSIIYTEKLDGQECYVIDVLGNKEWINKETGLLMKTKNGYLVRDDKRVPYYEVYSNWQINTVTDEQVAKPDATGYIKQK